MARWLHDNGKNYDRRALVLPYKGDLNWGGKHPQSYVANKNVGSRKGKHGESGGPVLAFVPDLEILERAIRLADRQVIGVVEHAPGHMEGWAAATKALNFVTRERHPGVPAEIHETLNDLERAGYNGYHRDREPFFAHGYFGPIDKLMEAGYTYEFVASYLLALGSFASRVGEHLKRIYVPREKRRKISKRYGG
ncbi:hypothetical protein BST25_18945 [Mycobacterium heidelbergense]|uniref:Uncharacterized protein n=2 Tax=Mycobacterium heidelbergense TaxID=53376 RepID=A0A1X0DDH2_MYCHE|nr:hypothetical protein BST25_18945 [Mycobacterium heidelbergense]